MTGEHHDSMQKMSEGFWFSLEDGTYLECLKDSYQPLLTEDETRKEHDQKARRRKHR
jgi:hypothetical protein